MDTLPAELIYHIADRLSDADKIALFEVYPNYKFTLNDFHLLDELIHLNRRLNYKLKMRGNITDKFTLTGVYLDEGQDLPSYFPETVKVDYFDWRSYFYFLSRLVSEMKYYQWTADEASQSFLETELEEAYRYEEIEHIEYYRQQIELIQETVRDNYIGYPHRLRIKVGRRGGILPAHFTFEEFAELVKTLIPMKLVADVRLNRGQLTLIMKE